MKYSDITFLNKDYQFVKGSIKVEDNIIVALEEYEPAQSERGIIPPFTDIHIHGGYNIDVMSAYSNDIKYMSERLWQDNVAMWLPTTVAKDYSSILKCAKEVKKAALNNKGAEIAGIHIEGPFLSPKYKGIMEEKYIKACDTRLFDDLKNIMGDMAIRFTLAPEAEGAEEFTKYVVKNGGFVSMGHSGATFSQCQKLVNLGANSYTHILNAMEGIHHRKENIALAALMGNEYCEVIADGIHILKPVLKFLFNNLDNRPVLITDALKPMAMGSGEFEFCGETISVKNNRATNNDGRLAGSIVKMKDAFLNTAEIVGIKKAVKYGCENPPKVINRFNDIGTIEVGKKIIINEI